MTFESVQKFCLSFPSVTEDLKWGADVCFCVGGKMFCVIDADFPHGLSFKCSEENFSELTEKDGIIAAPYLARYHWVRLENPTVLKEKELKSLIENSYRLVFEKLPKKEREKMKK